MIALDTNVPSELLKPSPDPAVVEWLRASGTDLCLTSMTIAELRLGVALLPGGKRRDSLATRIGRLSQEFAARILPFDQMAAQAYARVIASRRLAGHPMSPEDGVIAATAIAHGAALATRDTSDFEGLGLKLINPWE
ncbi:MAG: type II toxin-antitoxin system VapC family toxin [Bifidobacteriaceae bacterium]|jgi:predicted nucleic acid-binding protein|nr:type II toxin-antitoxin system VapC family toxin [Bifidobacteriaceae bacterium]